ncbi:MAG: DUF2029 domain-containing protein [Anaerolineales bacterium]|nr:DUF2029 domain-containing protein [Anaerolineales bacterium]
MLDFGSFYASGLTAQNGGNPYDPNSEYIFEIVFPEVGAGGRMMNLNPPISVVVFRFLAGHDPFRALFAWQIVSAVLFILSVIILAASYRSHLTPTLVFWVLTLAGFWHTLALGQVYVLLLFLTVTGWVFLQKGKIIPAGIAIGLVVAIKPNFALWVIFLFAAGYYKTAVVSAVAFLTISIIPVITYGMEIYPQWLEASVVEQSVLIMPGNSSILGLTARFGDNWLGIAVSGLLVLGLLAIAKIGTTKDMEKSEWVSSLGIIASLLASPISWAGYTILLLPVFFSLRKWNIPVKISAGLLSVPFGFVLQYFQLSFVNFILFGWLYGWAIATLLSAVVAKAIITKSIQTN